MNGMDGMEWNGMDYTRRDVPYRFMLLCAGLPFVIVQWPPRSYPVGDMPGVSASRKSTTLDTVLGTESSGLSKGSKRVTCFSQVNEHR